MEDGRWNGRRWRGGQVRGAVLQQKLLDDVEIVGGQAHFLLRRDAQQRETALRSCDEFASALADGIGGVPFIDKGPTYFLSASLFRRSFVDSSGVVVVVDPDDRAMS